jgi:hypothetical protein
MGMDLLAAKLVVKHFPETVAHSEEASKMDSVVVTGLASLTLIFQKLSLQVRRGVFDDKAGIQLTAPPSVRAALASALIAHV